MENKPNVLVVREHEKLQFPNDFPNDRIEEFQNLFGKASESKNEEERLKFLGIGSDFKAG